MSYRIYCKCDNFGRVIRTRLTDDNLGAPWILVPEEHAIDLRRDMYRFHYKDNQIVKKETARLSVSTPIFKADGQDHAAVMVIPDDPNYKKPIRLVINSEEIFVKPNEVIEIVSEKEGSFTIELVDDHIAAEKSRRETFARKNNE